MCCAVALWPRSSRMEVWGAFGDTPSLLDRGAADGVGGRYVQMHERGELTVYGGRVTPVAVFLAEVANRLAGENVVMVGADRFRRAECLDALNLAGVSWPMTWRGQGASATADGSADVRAFQRLTLSKKIAIRESLLMESAIADSSIRRDASGNPALAKARSHGRIDALSAAVIACGLAERVLAQPTRTLRSVVL